jgi:hypothetical protein
VTETFQPAGRSIAIQGGILAYNSAVEEQNLVVVGSYFNSPEAELARGALENAGIRAIIKSDSVGHMREHVAWAGAGYQILVQEEDAAAARDVLFPVPDARDTADTSVEGDGDPPATRSRLT